MPKSPISAPSDPVLSSLTARVQAVSDIYADAFGIERDEGWHLAKLQEELGELMAAHLKATGRGRTRRSDAEAKADTDEDILRRNVEDETADLFAQVLLRRVAGRRSAEGSGTQVVQLSRRRPAREVTREVKRQVNSWCAPPDQPVSSR